MSIVSAWLASAAGRDDSLELQLALQAASDAGVEAAEIDKGQSRLQQLLSLEALDEVLACRAVGEQELTKAIQAAEDAKVEEAKLHHARRQLKRLGAKRRLEEAVSSNNKELTRLALEEARAVLETRAESVLLQRVEQSLSKMSGSQPVHHEDTASSAELPHVASPSSAEVPAHVQPQPALASRMLNSVASVASRLLTSVVSPRKPSPHSELASRSRSSEDTFAADAKAERLSDVPPGQGTSGQALAPEAAPLALQTAAPDSNDAITDGYKAVTEMLQRRQSQRRRKVEEQALLKGGKSLDLEASTASKALGTPAAGVSQPPAVPESAVLHLRYPQKPTDVTKKRKCEGTPDPQQAVSHAPASSGNMCAGDEALQQWSLCLLEAAFLLCRKQSAIASENYEIAQQAKALETHANTRLVASKLEYQAKHQAKRPRSALADVKHRIQLAVEAEHFDLASELKEQQLRLEQRCDRALDLWADASEATKDAEIGKEDVRAAEVAISLLEQAGPEVLMLMFDPSVASCAEGASPELWAAVSKELGSSCQKT